MDVFELLQDSDLVEVRRRLVPEVLVAVVFHFRRVLEVGSKVEIGVPERPPEALLVVPPVHVRVLVGDRKREGGVGRGQGDVLRVAERVKRWVPEEIKTFEDLNLTLRHLVNSHLVNSVNRSTTIQISQLVNCCM